MFTGTRLTTAFHRRLSPWYFLRGGGASVHRLFDRQRGSNPELWIWLIGRSSRILHFDMDIFLLYVKRVSLNALWNRFRLCALKKERKFTWFRASCNWVILSAIFVSRLVTKQPWSHSGPPLCGVYNQTRAIFLSLLVCPKKTNLWKYLIEIFQRAHRFVSIWLKKWVLKFLQCCQKIIYHKLVVKCQGEPLQT